MYVPIPSLPCNQMASVPPYFVYIARELTHGSLLANYLIIYFKIFHHFTWDFLKTIVFYFL